MSKVKENLDPLDGLTWLKATTDRGESQVMIPISIDNPNRAVIGVGSTSKIALANALELRKAERARQRD